MIIELITIGGAILTAVFIYMLLSRKRTCYCEILEVGEQLEEDVRTVLVRVYEGNLTVSQFIDYSLDNATARFQVVGIQKNGAVVRSVTIGETVTIALRGNSTDRLDLRGHLGAQGVYQGHR